MGFFGTDWIQSALTPRGSNNALGRDERNSSVQQGYADLFKQYQPVAQQGIDFAKSMFPQYQQNFRNTLDSFSQNGVDADVRRFGNQASENAGRNAQQSNALLAGQGFGDGARAGSTLAATNQAQQATNAYAQQMNSPQAKAQRSQYVMQLLQQGLAPTEILQMLGGLSSGVYGQPSPWVGQSPASQIGGFVGDYIGAKNAGKK